MSMFFSSSFVEERYSLTIVQVEIKLLNFFWSKCMYVAFWFNVRVLIFSTKDKLINYAIM